MAAMNSAVIGAGGCVYVLLPSLDLPGGNGRDALVELDVAGTKVWPRRFPS